MREYRQSYSREESLIPTSLCVTPSVMSKTLCKDAVMIPITVIERYVVIMTPNIEQKHDISFEMAQNVIFLHLYNM